MLFLACMIALAQASPISKMPLNLQTVEVGRTNLESAGTILSWMSTFLYVGSRFPQLIKNWRRKSTAGLSPHLFIAAFCGNMFYSSALATNPNAWEDFGPYGGGGWAGAEGNDRTQWILTALPFFLGAAGVLGLDASMGVQFLMYGETSEKLVIVEEAPGRRNWHYRRVSGWIRGWLPSGSGSLSKSAEREALVVETNDDRPEGYGAL